MLICEEGVNGVSVLVVIIVVIIIINISRRKSDYLLLLLLFLYDNIRLLCVIVSVRNIIIISVSSLTVIIV